MNNIDYKKFQDWILELSLKEYPVKKQQIMSACSISSMVFSFWKTGRTTIPPLAKKEIEKIAGKEIFNN
jgi:hypothetical protein